MAKMLKIRRQNMTPQRLITERQEQIYRMRHHDFGGMTTKQVATELGVKPRVIRKHMQKMKSIAPQLFPILAKRQAEVLRLWLSLSPQEMGLYLNIEVMTVYGILRDLRNMGVLIPGERHRPKRYADWMDFWIKQKF